ncbi:MAG: hypothetical protein ACOVNL_07650 [Prochlorococcaceae cyanobacterium]
MACPTCGSWAVRADRSLAGRMVCGRCGRPLTGTVVDLERHRRRRQRWRGLPTLPRLRRRWWILAALLTVSALLAVRQEAPPAAPRPPAPLGPLS